MAYGDISNGLLVLLVGFAGNSALAWRENDIGTHDLGVIMFKNKNPRCPRVRPCSSKAPCIFPAFFLYFDQASKMTKNMT